MDSALQNVPCVGACPAHIDIPGYIALVQAGRMEDALRLIRQENPFPSVCALICDHPCEAHCRRGKIDAPVNIRALKRFAAEQSAAIPYPTSAPKNGKSVAIIGSGPSGLTAACFLALAGFSVTVFEKQKQLGGMLRYGIPRYRLPASYLDRDIEAILALGVEIKTGVTIGQTLTLDSLRGQYDSVYISIGAHADRRLGIEGESSRGVFSAIRFLRELVEKEPPDYSGKRVVVIGGGNTAMDATRTALRLGTESVTCVYRRRLCDMTALPEEIESATTEGAVLLPLMVPVRIESDENQNTTAVVLRPQKVVSCGEERPIPQDSGEADQLLPADIVLFAIGQAVEADHFAESGAQTDRGTFITDAFCAIPRMENVFSGGDCTTGPATVILAVEAGKIAAANIAEKLGVPLWPKETIAIPPAKPQKAVLPRVELPKKAVSSMKGNFELTEPGLSAEQALAECSRCLRCDHRKG